MRNLPGLLFQYAGLRTSLALSVSAFSLSWLAAAGEAHASGPVERMVEVLLSPSDPSKVVVRWGVASEGYLYSSDSGHTFAALCSQAIAPNLDEEDKIKHLSSQNVPSAAATLIDTHGKLMVGQTDGLWVDDGSGCSWSKQLDGMWPYSIKRDPKNADELIAVVNTHSATEADTHLMRRDADGVTWTQLGALLPPTDKQYAYGGDLIASSTATGTQLYVSVNVTVGDLTMNPKQQSVIVGSSDGGNTWSTSFTQPDTQEPLTLLAIDPSEPKRILATVYRDTAADTLMISEDQGKTFTALQDIRETSGIAFGPDGRLYISDAGDSTGSNAIGGLYTAAKLGDPLTLVANTSLLDCITYDPASQKLFACIRDKVGMLDPVSGQFSELAELNTIPGMVACPGLDMVAACLTEYNAGASWCCAGHYPFTSFCGDYDVTMKNGQILYCGLSGRAYDSMVGRGPNDGGVSNAEDAGSEPDSGATRDGGATSDAAVHTSSPKSGSNGCSIAVGTPGPSFGAAFASLGFVLVALGRSLARRSRR